MSLREALLSLGVALAAGALVGAERQQAQAARERADFGGIRTFPLISLAGALGALLVPAVGAWALVVPFAGLSALLSVSHATGASEDRGLSTEVAALVVFALGAVAALPQVLPSTERYLLVAAGAAVVMALLALKRPLHGFVARVSADDVYATVKFVVLALVVLPILPNRVFGPFDALNPFRIGLMVVLVAGISFAGFVAVRLVGDRRGLLATGLLGGLVSSTAVTLTFSGRAKAGPDVASLCAIAILAASATMFARVVVIVAVVDAPLLPALAWPMGAMCVAGFGVGGFLYRREAQRPPSPEPVQFRNPFELKKAVAFGLFYAVVLFIARAAQTYFGTKGLYGSTVLAATHDVDAITLTVAELHAQGLDGGTAATAITLAAATNTVVKAGMAFVLGGPQFGRRVGAAFLVVLLVGAVALLAV